MSAERTPDSNPENVALQVIRDNLFRTDRRINEGVQQIRREIVVHATVHGAKDFSACLVLMSVVKDAERVGDQAKNILELAELTPERPGGEYRDQLVQLKDRISQLMFQCRVAFDALDIDLAREQIDEANVIKDVCDEQVAKLIRAGQEVPLATSYALAYRFFKRVTAHAFNVATSIVQPVDKIDFSEKPDALDVE